MQSAAVVRGQLITGLQGPAFSGKWLGNPNFTFMRRHGMLGRYLQLDHFGAAQGDISGGGRFHLEAEYSAYTQNQ